MTDRKTRVSELLALKAIIKELEREHDRQRAELGDMFTDPGEREVGTLHDHRLGTVSLEAGAEYWTVADAHAFEIWVGLHAPRELINVLAVRPSFQAAVLARCKRDGGYVDPITGEVEIPDGLALRKGAPKLVERTDEHAGFVVRGFIEKLGIEASP